MALIKRTIIVVFLSFLMLNSYAQISDTLSPNDFLSLSLEDLFLIKVVSAGKHQQDIQKTPASVTLITRQDIERFGYRSLQEVLNQVPGLYKPKSICR